MTIQNSKLEAEDKQFLLELAKEAIKSKLENREPKIPKNIPPKLKEKRGTFVTLTIDGQLRGCIGHILPVQELYKDVIENARAAAFDDPRFPPLTKEGLPKINPHTKDSGVGVKIEISVLTLPKKFEYESSQMLVSYLDKFKPGVILKKGHCRATFLPQVWEEVKDPEEFLAHLCLKAGLSPNEWACGVEVQTYSVEKFSS